jgi:hypothetical protein
MSLTFQQLCHGMNSEELAAFSQHRADVNDYLAQKREFCKSGMSLSQYVHSKMADSAGVWPGSTASPHLATQLPAALQSALAKADRHLPVVSQANPLTFDVGDASTTGAAGLAATSYGVALAGDPDGAYRAEYEANAEHYRSMGLSLSEFVASRRIDDGLDSLAPATAVA